MAVVNLHNYAQDVEYWNFLAFGIIFGVLAVGLILIARIFRKRIKFTISLIEEGSR